MGMAKKTSIAEELRAAIAKAEAKGMSRYAIAKAAGLRTSVVARIADGTLPRLDTAEKIAGAIGLRLTLCAT
jgi:DNA-binding phage protein